jgi:hypothetical protein
MDAVEGLELLAEVLFQGGTITDVWAVGVLFFVVVIELNQDMQVGDFCSRPSHRGVLFMASALGRSPPPRRDLPPTSGNAESSSLTMPANYDMQS